MIVAILVAEGFEEIETSVTYDVLKRAGIEVLTAGLKPGPITGSRGLRIVCDIVVDELKASALDALIIPGGYPGYVNLGKSAVVLNLIRTMASAGKDLASICAGPLVLEQAGVIKGKTVTCFPGTESSLKTARFSPQRVIEDGNIITSRGPGTAMDFALKLVERWAGYESAGKIRKELVV